MASCVSGALDCIDGRTRVMTAESKAWQSVPPLPPLRGTLGQRAPTPPSSPHWLWIPQWTTHSSFPVPLFMTRHPLKQHLSVCVRVCAWVHGCVCALVSLEQLSLGERINVSAWRYQTWSVCLSTLRVDRRHLSRYDKGIHLCDSCFSHCCTQGGI